MVELWLEALSVNASASKTLKSWLKSALFHILQPLYWRQRQSQRLDTRFTGRQETESWVRPHSSQLFCLQIVVIGSEATDVFIKPSRLRSNRYLWDAAQINPCLSWRSPHNCSSLLFTFSQRNPRTQKDNGLNKPCGCRSDGPVGQVSG